MSRKIIDEFSDLPIRSGMKWYLRSKRDCRCYLCGKLAMAERSMCFDCATYKMVSLVSVPVFKDTLCDDRKEWKRKAIMKAASGSDQISEQLTDETPWWLRRAARKAI